MKTKTRKHHTKRTNYTPKPDVYTQVTGRICGLLERGVAPWQSNCLAAVGFPRNFSTGSHYRGINVFLLGAMGYASPFFLTFLQAKELGGNVRKGEKGSLVLKYGTYTKKGESPEDGERKRGFLKCYTVFNSSQIEGIDFPQPKAAKPENRDATIGAAQAIIDGMPTPPTIVEGKTAQPHYQPVTDTVHMPGREMFKSLEGFYKTHLHELVHATGSANRLARETLLKNRGINTSGESKKIYSKEELVAELGAAFLAATAGIVTDDHENSAAYLGSWLAVLKVKENRRWIVEAAAQAQKAADYILDRKE